MQEPIHEPDHSADEYGPTRDQFAKRGGVGAYPMLSTPRIVLRVGYPSAPIDELPMTPRREPGAVLQLREKSPRSAMQSEWSEQRSNRAGIVGHCLEVPADQTWRSNLPDAGRETGPSQVVDSDASQVPGSRHPVLRGVPAPACDLLLLSVPLGAFVKRVSEFVT